MPALTPPRTQRVRHVAVEDLVHGDVIHHEGERLTVHHVTVTTCATFPGGPRVPMVRVISTHDVARYAPPGTLIRCTAR